MNRSRQSLLSIALVSLATVARAQSGSLDQVSPQVSASYNGASMFIWQAQVRAGLAGRLEGFTLRLNGAQGTAVDTQLRLGPGWNTGAIVFQSTAVKATSADEDVFVDSTSAGIYVAPGQVFVIELQGTGFAPSPLGSYVDPVTGPPLYPEPMFLGGPGCFSNCGWRIACKTWIDSGPIPQFCVGDGSSTACPCGNSGAVGHGCASSTFASGALLSVGGTAGASAATDTLILTASNIPGPGLFFQADGLAATPFNFGDGLLCAAGNIIRLGVVFPSSGTASYPGGLTPAPIHTAGLVNAGDIKHYQCWYRAFPGLCSANNYDLTQGVTISWGS